MVAVIYFAHDLWDTAVERRVEMLRAGGASVQVVGFRRRDPARGEILGDPSVDLGRVDDGALARRAATILARGLSARRWGAGLTDADVIVARSLELLVLAWLFRLVTGARAPLVYECLDIHRLMFSKGLMGRALRGLERRLLKHCPLVLVSSPAFAEHHFAAVHGRRTGVRLIENKLALAVAEAGHLTARPNSPPWRIGWFGMIRCAKSLQVLRSLCAALPGVVEVVIAGRVSQGEFEDFDAQVAGEAGITFLGPYAPSQLSELYSQVHFVWAIDFFEEGLNSAWLLPNRIYEGCAFGSVPIALRSTETGRWLMTREIGVMLDAGTPTELAAFFGTLDGAAYAEVARPVAELPRSAVQTTQADCDALVALLASAAQGAVQ